MSAVDLSDVLAPLRYRACTGLTADWCPNHGQCTCPDRMEAMDSDHCPLHNGESNHPLAAAPTGEEDR